MYYLPNTLPVEERTCWFCEDGSVEDECYFLFNCKLYTERTECKDLMCYCRNPSFEHLTSIDNANCSSSHPRMAIPFCFTFVNMYRLHSISDDPHYIHTLVC